MGKETLNELECLKKIKESYDAFYFENKYGDGTHKKEFEKLRNFFKKDETSLKDLAFIEATYDCYYKDEWDEENEENPFYYLEVKIKELTKESEVK